MEFDVIKIMTHPKFNSRNLQNDIAILRVDPAIPLGVYPTIATACLPDKLINQNLTCFVSGWGRNDFDVILQFWWDMWTIHKYHTFHYSIVRNQSGHSEKGGRSNCWQSDMWSNSQNDETRKILQARSGFHVCRRWSRKRCCKLLKNSWSAIVNIDTISTLVHWRWGKCSEL